MGARTGPGLAAALLAASLAAPAAAEERPTPVSVDWAVDGGVTGGALALWIGSEAAKDQLAPPECRWCQTSSLDARVRDLVVWSSTKGAANASNAMVVAVPLGVAVYDGVRVGSLGAALPDVLLIGEAVALSGLIAQGTKFIAARQRPYAYHGTQPLEGVDDHLSFYSAHTTIAFSAVAAGGMLAQLRGDPAWPWVYGVGFTAAAATGYFRMAADKHWLTDVLAGAATGTAVGLAVPWLHRNPSAAGAIRISPAPRGVVLSANL